MNTFKNNGKLKLLIIVGTRPEIIRLAAVINKSRQYFDTILAHTGQNYDYNLNGVFFKDLKLADPEVYMNTVGNDLGETMGNIIAKSYQLMVEIQPDAVLVLGDTNSCLSVIGAKRLHIPIFHMEAGNRCKDECLPEETNRRIVDIISDVNMAYSEHARRYLADCGLPKERTYVTGSPMAEVLHNNLKEIEASDIHARLGLEKGKYILFDVKSSTSAIQYILIKSIKLNGGERAKNLDVLEEVSFDNPTLMVGNNDTSSYGYWSCSGRKGLHNSEVRYCDYVVDAYFLVYGDAEALTYSASELNEWINKAWCMYNYKEGPESFVKLSDECPIDVVDSQTVLSVTKKLSSITGRGWNYHKLGYEDMPMYLFGTDGSGNDVLKKSFAGLRTSLILSAIVFVICFTFGIIWGSVSGYFGGNIDLILERIVEIISGIPFLVVLTLLRLHFGATFLVMAIAFCAKDWIGTAGLTRTQFYRFKGREYVLASRTLGASNKRLIFRHVLPNSLGTIITYSVLLIPGIIASEATFSFLHLGIENMHSFGVFMSNNYSYLEKYPYLVIFPAVIMGLMMIMFNLFGNGLRDAFNPTLKGSD